MGIFKTTYPIKTKFDCYTTCIQLCVLLLIIIPLQLNANPIDSLLIQLEETIAPRKTY